MKSIPHKPEPSFSDAAQKIVINGLYEHYKGQRYRVLAIAHHSETLEELVVYQALYGQERVWVRPLAMFLENVTVEGQPKPRFRFIA